MTTQRKLARHAVAVFSAIAFVVAPLSVSSAFADGTKDRAKIHYKKGKELFSAGDYAGAVREFQAADRLSPSAVLDYNIGLAYEELGEDAKAVDHYRAYLDRDPNASNRSSVEARISRLVASMEAAAEAAAEARAAEEARRAAEAEAKRPPVEDPPPVVDDPPPVVNDPPVETRPEPPPVETRPADPPVSTGDPELDRVNGINIADIRDQRSHNMPATTHESFGEPTNSYGGAEQAPPPVSDSGKSKSKPAYKQWWFWVVVGVSAIILIDIMSTDSGNGAQPATGATIFSF